MKRERYVSINLPFSLIKEVDKLVSRHGYSSRAEFVKEAIREHLLRVKMLEGEKYAHL